MGRFLNKDVLIIILVVLMTAINKSEETCQMLKKTIALYYNIERILYRYVTCTNMIPSDLHREVLSTVNSSSSYLVISNSDLPEISKEMFLYLNLTQITIDANVQMIQDKTFERSNISTITLANNKVRRIKEAAFKSFAIYFIDLQNNLMSEIESQSFSGAQNLRKLNLEGNQISNIQQDAFQDLGNLEEINLSFNHLSTFPSKIFWPMSNVQTIHLNNNLINQIDIKLFIKNNMLQDFNLNNNFLTYLDATYFPHSLVNLNAEQNNLNSVTIFNLTNLNKLILNSNKLRNLKNAFNNLPSLNSLHLNNNFLGPTVTDNLFIGLSNLVMLELDGNQIIHFNSLKRMNNLEGLSLAENDIKRMDFSGIPANIKTVNLTHNSLIEIGNLTALHNLTKLELSHNNLEEISFDLLEGSHRLHNLWLHHNRIKKLTLGCFRSLNALEQLDLSYNKIVNVTAGTLNGLDTITELNLSYNNLSFLSEDVFHNMKDLRYLNIAYNNLSNVNIKGILSHTIWLKEMDINGNDWSCKLLVNISRDNKLIKMTGGNFYNVSNIYGIPCRDTVDIKIKNNPASNERVAEMNSSINKIVTNSDGISVKLSVIITLLILYLILGCGKYLFSKYNTQITAAKQFVYQKSQSEPEIHLI